MASATLSLEQRQKILSRVIANYSAAGWRVTAQTGASVQMVKPKSFSCLWASLWFLMFGIGLLFYLFYYWAKKDETVFITVDEFGTIRRK